MLRRSLKRLGTVSVIAGLAAAPSCSRSASEARNMGATTVDESQQIAGAVVRVHIGQATFDLSILEMAPISDAGGEPPQCIVKTNGAQFDLNWSRSKGDSGHSGPAHLTIATPSGTSLIVEKTTNGCEPLQDASFELVPHGTQLVLGAAINGQRPTSLVVTANGVSRTVRLWPTCTEADYTSTGVTRPACAPDPLNYDAQTVYSTDAGS